MLGRIVIDAVRPSTPAGYPAKAVVGERATVAADIFRDGHDLLAARVKWRLVGEKGERSWQSAPLSLVVNDRWEGVLTADRVGAYQFVIEAWTDRFGTWRHDIELKAAAGQDLTTQLEEGARFLDFLARLVPKAARAALGEAAKVLRDEDRPLAARLNAGLDDHVAAVVAGVPDPTDLTRSSTYTLWVDRELARNGTWYEFFPRSEGGFEGAMKRLPAIADMGFDIVYLPPIHPIGITDRKGRNNTLTPTPDDPGSPWAIGGAEGGHTDVHPELGTIDDFDRFVAEAAAHRLEVALDYALQCSPDHPWVRDHPEWFHHRPDGTIKFAENPPKKYQDIYPINFWPEDDNDRVALWEACKAILDHWLDHGIRVFRVDNPHTKPLAFWDWLLAAVRADHADTVFLAEAFTRPKMMAKLAEIGFSQSYTYFTWRTAKWELEEYLTELAHGPTADYMRPNFWPNTPDILSGPLRDGPPAAFMIRLVLAATMAPAYGIYSGYELCENAPMSDLNEEYLFAEKYEVKARDWTEPSLVPFITQINEIRRRHPAFSQLRTIQFHGADNDEIIVYSKRDPATADTVLVVVNLDPTRWQEATLGLDLGALGLSGHEPFPVVDELGGATFLWSNANPYVRLDPALGQVAHVLRLERR